MADALFEGVPRETVIELYVGACERIAELEAGLESPITNEPGTSWEWREDGSLHIRRVDAAADEIEKAHAYLDLLEVPRVSPGMLDTEMTLALRVALLAERARG